MRWRRSTASMLHCIQISIRWTTHTIGRSRCRASGTRNITCYKQTEHIETQSTITKSHDMTWSKINECKQASNQPNHEKEQEQAKTSENVRKQWLVELHQRPNNGTAVQTCVFTWNYGVPEEGQLMQSVELKPLHSWQEAAHTEQKKKQERNKEQQRIKRNGMESKEQDTKGCKQAMTLLHIREQMRDWLQ